MKVTVNKEELFPLYYEENEDKWYKMLVDLDVDPRVWEDYKFARDNFVELTRKLERMEK